MHSVFSAVVFETVRRVVLRYVAVLATTCGVHVVPLVVLRYVAVLATTCGVHGATCQSVNGADRQRSIVCWMGGPVFLCGGVVQFDQLMASGTVRGREGLQGLSLSLLLLQSSFLDGTQNSLR